MPLSTTIHYEFSEQPANGSLCDCCECVMTGKMYNLVLFVDVEPIYTNLMYCESCKYDTERKG